MSHHLKILATAGLLTTRREGNSIFYRRAIVASNNALETLTNSLFKSIDQIRIPAETTRRVGEIHGDRSLRSKRFFERNADRLKQNQDLIAEFSHYGDCILELLCNEGLPSSTRVIEVGPGESPLINLLAQQFDQLCALDNSEEMLNKARATLAKKYRSKVQFILGDLHYALECADLIVLNMVLHHLASPSRFFVSAADRINPEGRLLIIDLCSHDQDWARDTCGDLWLGFDPLDLDNWAEKAAFIKGQSTYIGLKNGFQVQVRLFHKPSST